MTTTNTADRPTIVLKTLFDDIMRDNPNSTLDTKKMRAKLRVEMREVHVHNSSWIFNAAQYDAARSLFDPAYAEKLARRAKRADKPKSTTTRKSRAKSNAVVAVEPAKNEEPVNA